MESKCEHPKEKVKAVFCEFWNKNQNGFDVHKSWISEWRCDCGAKVFPETYKEVETGIEPGEDCPICRNGPDCEIHAGLAPV